MSEKKQQFETVTMINYKW